MQWIALLPLWQINRVQPSKVPGPMLAWSMSPVRSMSPGFMASFACRNVKFTPWRAGHPSAGHAIYFSAPSPYFSPPLGIKRTHVALVLVTLVYILYYSLLKCWPSHRIGFFFTSRSLPGRQGTRLVRSPSSEMEPDIDCRPHSGHMPRVGSSEAQGIGFV